MNLLQWLGWLAAVALAFALHSKSGDLEETRRALEARSRAAASQPAASPPPPAPSRQAAPDCRAEVAGLLDRIAELEAEVDSSSAEAQEARAAADQYRSGLEQAVDTLNRQQRSSRAAPPPPAGSTADSANVFVRQPRVSHVDRSLVVAGTVNNVSSQTAAGEVELVLLDGRGQEVDRVSIPLEIPPRTVRDYSHEFYVMGSGSYRVQPTWKPGTW